MAFIAVLIGVVIALVVGVSLVPVVVDQVNLSSEDAPEAIVNLLDLLPTVFIALLIIGAVGFLGRVSLNDDPTERPSTAEGRKKLLEATILSRRLKVRKPRTFFGHRFVIGKRGEEK